MKGSMSEAGFRHYVIRTFKAECWKMTVDDLLVNPRLALWFCEHIRRQVGCPDESDDTILRTLINVRKAGLSVKGKGRAK